MNFLDTLLGGKNSDRGEPTLDSTQAGTDNSGSLGGLLNQLSGLYNQGSEIYKNVLTPNTTTPRTPAGARVTTSPTSSSFLSGKTPWIIGGAVVAVVLLVLVFRRR